MSNRFLLALFLIFGSLLSLTSCSQVKESPAIYITNATSGIIKNIECNWVGQNMLTLQSVTPGDSRAKSFIIKKNNDFFGPVTMSWTNDEGKKITKNFNFSKDRLPSISSKRMYSYVQVYLMLNDIEVISSDDDNADNMVRAMDAMAHRNRQEAEKRGIYGACVPNRINLYNCPTPSSNALIDSIP
ncbi:MAG: hypothetical protein KGQ36_07190, partial [Rickettsiales bacterium]|nr:hypothetical protein [Rickettsiales bacterium]